MIQIKNSEQLAIMRKAGRITGEAILVARDHIKEGVSTKELDTVIRHYIEKCGATPSFLGYGGFPGSACISINNEVIHGIPSADRILREGDIVKIDVGACYHGFHGDSANTFGVGKISEDAEELIRTTRESFFRAAEKATAGARLGVGHGVGQNLHEDPEVPNFGTAGRGMRLYTGMTIAIEPMINIGSPDVKVLSDGWTVVTADGGLSAHYEHTVAITEGKPVLLTLVE